MVEVADADDAAARAGTALEVVVVVEGRTGPGTRKVVDAVLAARPDAVVVHTGLGRPRKAGGSARWSPTPADGRPPSPCATPSDWRDHA